MHLFAYRSPCCQKKPLWNKSFQKLARTIVGKESTIETEPKKLLVKASNCSEVNWKVAYTFLPQWWVEDPTKPFCMGSMEEAYKTSGDQKCCSWNIQVTGLQHIIVCTVWCSSKTLQECINKVDWPATKNTLPITKNQLLPHKTGAQAIGCLFLKENVRGEKILPRHPRKSCIRTGLIMWKGKSLSWQSYRALNQANYHRDKAAWLLQGGSHVSDGLY